jgi:hypothetical protein
MRAYVLRSLAVLLLVCCKPSEPGGDVIRPVLPAARALPAFEHQGPVANSNLADTVPVSWPEYILHADSGSAMPQAGIAHLCGVHLVVRDSLGRIVAEVTAATGEFDRRREIVVARGAVIVDLPLQGRRIETAELHYAPRYDRVWSPTTTIFREGDAVLTGSSFTANRHFETVRVERARGRLRVP